uniref:Centrosomal protein 95 n=1 Tax=Myripristis murdjan TaxID=586833 RepID=A0A667ZWE6_9TELE
MGIQELKPKATSEHDWVDVANDLLSKCHINLRLRKVTDCDANVFIALYESILGEKVPDYIAAPCCQEDDVHNVQSVIDSLALDYLQISLSHITGENIVRGDKESIKNLLEIFDGLLEYLNEEISEESHNGGKHELIQVFSLLIQICASQLIYSFIYVCIFTPKINILPNNYRMEEDGYDDPLSYRRQKNRQTEEELHLMSEKLSRRLEELDEMLKRALGESGESSEVREEDKQSHHSDSIMECRRTPRPQTGTHSSSLKHTHTHTHTHTYLTQMLNSPRIAIEALSHTICMFLFQHVMSKAYEEELKRYEDRERANLDKERLKAQEAVSHGMAYKHPRHTHTTGHANRNMKVKENDLLPILMEEFPHLHISRHTLGRMWEQQLQQVDRLHAISSHSHQKRNKLSSQVEEAQKKHDLLVEIVRKEQEHSRRLRDFKERIQQQKSAQNRLKEQRQQIARAKKYHNDYHVQLRARLMRERTKEEKMFRQLFEEGLELQKARLREQRAYAREKRLEHQRRHQDQIKSMENYYKDQFSLLAEALAQEREEIQVRKKAQEKTLLKMRRELRSRMEREIGELQRIIIQNDEDDYFRELDVQRLRRRVQMASFQYSTSCLP